jgi:hypothetical protein
MTGAEPVPDGLADLTLLEESTLVSLQDLLSSIATELPGVRACTLTVQSPLGEAVIFSAEVTGFDDLPQVSPSHPFAVDGHTAGALTLHMNAGGSSVDPARVAHAMGQVAGFLAAATTPAERDREIAQRTRAMKSRTVIGQAVGLLMAQTHCRADTAMHALRRQSQHSNLKLRDIADALVREHDVAIEEEATAPMPPAGPSPSNRLEDAGSHVGPD